jgi:hypothetical protein
MSADPVTYRRLSTEKNGFFEIDRIMVGESVGAGILRTIMNV